MKTLCEGLRRRCSGRVRSDQDRSDIGTVLAEYQASKMTGGYADSLTLFFFDDGLNGRAIDMSKSFSTG